MTISGRRTEQLDIFCRVTGFTSDFLSFIVVELIRFFHGAIQSTSLAVFRNMSQGVAGFFGIPDEDKTEQQRRHNEWKERTRRMHSSGMFLRGHKLAHDQPDAASASLVRYHIWVFFYTMSRGKKRATFISVVTLADVEQFSQGLPC